MINIHTNLYLKSRAVVFCVIFQEMLHEKKKNWDISVVSSTSMFMTVEYRSRMNTYWALAYCKFPLQKSLRLVIISADGLKISNSSQLKISGGGWLWPNLRVNVGQWYSTLVFWPRNWRCVMELTTLGIDRTWNRYTSRNIKHHLNVIKEITQYISFRD